MENNLVKRLSKAKDEINKLFDSDDAGLIPNKVTGKYIDEE